MTDDALSSPAYQEPDWMGRWRQRHKEMVPVVSAAFLAELRLTHQGEPRTASQHAKALMEEMDITGEVLAERLDVSVSRVNALLITSPEGTSSSIDADIPKRAQRTLPAVRIAHELRPLVMAALTDGKVLPSGYALDPARTNEPPTLLPTRRRHPGESFLSGAGLAYEGPLKNAAGHLGQLMTTLDLDPAAVGRAIKPLVDAALDAGHQLSSHYRVSSSHQQRSSERKR